MSQVPDTPRQPKQADDRRPFWRGVSVGIGLVLSAYLLLTAIVNTLNRQEREARPPASTLHISCGQADFTVLADGSAHTVRRGEALVLPIVDKAVGWRCSADLEVRTMTCTARSDHLLVVRFPGSDKMSMQCGDARDFGFPRDLRGDGSAARG